MKFFIAGSMFLALFTSNVWSKSEGVGSSGGGGAYVCRNKLGEITSSHLVDLWESEFIHFNWISGESPKVLSIEYSFENEVDEIVKSRLEILARQDHLFAEEVSREYYYVKKNINYLHEDISITIPADLNIDYFKSGCPAEGMMRYNGVTNRLDIKREIFNKLQTKSDVAAAFLHEAIYNIARKYFETKNSIKVRRLVACLFSSSKCFEEVKAPKVKSFLSCSSNNLEFKAYPVGSQDNLDLGGWEIIYSQIGGHKLMAYSFQPLDIKAPGLTLIHTGENVVFGALEKFGIYIGKIDLDFFSNVDSLSESVSINSLRTFEFAYGSRMNSTIRKLTNEPIYCTWSE